MIKINIILTEIYRRLKYVNREGLKSKTLYLDVPSSVKKLVELGVLKPSFNEKKRVLNWYSLTEKGINFFESVNFGNNKTEQENLDIFEGRKTFNFYKLILNETNN